MKLTREEARAIICILDRKKPEEVTEKEIQETIECAKASWEMDDEEDN